MRSPIRIQRKRTKGWRMPSNTVSVTRPGKWGNPFEASRYGQEEAVRLHCIAITTAMHMGPDWLPGPLEELRGKNLACFCALDQPCHADVLLEIANTEAAE